MFIVYAFVSYVQPQHKRDMFNCNPAIVHCVQHVFLQKEISFDFKFSCRQKDVLPNGRRNIRVVETVVACCWFATKFPKQRNEYSGWRTASTASCRLYTHSLPQFCVQKNWGSTVIYRSKLRRIATVISSNRKSILLVGRTCTGAQRCPAPLIKHMLMRWHHGNNRYHHARATTNSDYAVRGIRIQRDEENENRKNATVKRKRRECVEKERKW